MAEPDQLVPDLLSLGLELHGIGERLPSAPSAESEMRAERLETVGGRLHHPYRKTFHIVFLLLEDAYVDEISGNRELDEQYLSVHMGQRLAFRRYGLDADVLKNQIRFLFGHAFVLILQIYKIFITL